MGMVIDMGMEMDILRGQTKARVMFDPDGAILLDVLLDHSHGSNVEIMLCRGAFLAYFAFVLIPLAGRLDVLQMLMLRRGGGPLFLVLHGVARM